ncbi:hypothetical protein JB92DRAFT_2881636 [Gautieria morchelliformis]|nr:hypothetical protein JB92DRAFT_2881636 [Gautieria morchelliformis]
MVITCGIRLTSLIDTYASPSSPNAVPRPGPVPSKMAMVSGPHSDSPPVRDMSRVRLMSTTSENRGCHLYCGIDVQRIILLSSDPSPSPLRRWYSC